MATWWLHSFAAVALALLTSTAAACTSSDQPPAQTPTTSPTEPAAISASPATPAVTITATPPTGIASVNAAIAAVESGDIDALMRQVTYAQGPCVTRAEVQPLDGRALCEPGEFTGDLVEGFVTAQCEGGVIRRGASAAIRQALQYYLHGPLRFYGAYSTPLQTWGAGKYTVVFSSAPGGPEYAAVAILDDSGIVGAGTGCGSTPAQLGASWQPLAGGPTKVPETPRRLSAFR
jgi:hypothetical protein